MADKILGTLLILLWWAIAVAGNYAVATSPDTPPLSAAISVVVIAASNFIAIALVALIALASSRRPE